MPYKITIDKEACIGCGVCESTYPANFVMKGDKATVKKAKISDKELEKNKEAADICPTQAIKIEKA